MFETSLKASFLTAAQRTGRGGFVWWLHRDTPAEHTAAVLVSAWSQFGTAHLRCSCWCFKRITSFKQVKEAAPHLYSAVDFPRQCSNRDVENTDRERELGAETWQVMNVCFGDLKHVLIAVAAMDGAVAENTATRAGHCEYKQPLFELGLVVIRRKYCRIYLLLFFKKC